MIRIQNLGFAYSRKQGPLFAGLDLDLEAGTICGMLGANGAGKSTLLKILAGLTFPQSGSCEVLGQRPGDRNPSFLADIFLLPEEVWVPPLTARDYVRMYGTLYRRFDRARFEALQAEFGLPAGQKLDTLSLGQKKEFLLAFGIATHSRLLILDEPTNALDIPGKRQFRKALIGHFDPERSIVISTHHVRDLQSLIDQVLIIANGRILLHETLDNLGARVGTAIEHEPPADALAAEETLEGYHVLRERRGGAGEGSVDLGLLFRFVTERSADAQGLFGQGRSA